MVVSIKNKYFHVIFMRRGVTKGDVHFSIILLFPFMLFIPTANSLVCLATRFSIPCATIVSLLFQYCIPAPDEPAFEKQNLVVLLVWL